MCGISDQMFHNLIVFALIPINKANKANQIIRRHAITTANKYYHFSFFIGCRGI